MSLSLEQFIEIAKLVGLVAAGGWTAWTFYRLQTIRKADNDIAKSRMDIEKSRVEIEKSRIDMEKGRTDTEKARIDIEKGRIEIRSQQPQLAIGLEVSEVDSPYPSYVSVLIITVVLK